MNFLTQTCKALDIDLNSALELPRAATGIYLALKYFDQNKKILMPANICYSPIRVSIEASYKPVFYNASRLSYDCNDIVKIANNDPKINAILLPMLYGYVPSNLDSLKQLDKSRKWLIIEDLAQTFGPGLAVNLGANITKVSIYSFGKTKFIKEFRAGLITCNNQSYLNGMKFLYLNLPTLDSGEEDKLTEEIDKFKIIARDTKNWFDYYKKLNQLDSRYFVRRQINQSNNEIPIQLVEKRKDVVYRNVELLISRLQNFEAFMLPNKFDYSRHNPVWRLTIRVDRVLRELVLKQLRNSGLSVSAWYEVVPFYLNLISSEESQESLNFQEEVLNFWVDENHGENYQNQIMLILSRLEANSWRA